MTLTHDRFADADTATRHTAGWTESLERLGALIDASPRPKRPKQRLHRRRNVEWTRTPGDGARTWS